MRVVRLTMKLFGQYVFQTLVLFFYKNTLQVGYEVCDGINP